MASDSVQIFRQCDLKQKDISKFVLPRDYLYTKDKIQNHSENKSTRKFKPMKKFQENKKSLKDSKIEDVFLNSEYFKHQTSSSLGSLSFCSGDNGEHRWTIDSNFQMPSHQKNLRAYSYSDMIKNYSQNYNVNKQAAKEGDSLVSNPTEGKLKTQSCSSVKVVQREKILEKASEKTLTENENIDGELVALITEQMYLAEKELQSTRSHLIETINKLNERDLEIIQLHEKLKSLQKSEKKNFECGNSGLLNASYPEDYQKLVSASEKLKQQVKDMEEFLNDYGLVWIGDKKFNSKPDFDKIIKNFQRLNSIAAQPKIIQTTLGAKFELPREISVVLYANGILLRGRDFREYSKMSTTLFLQDVEDGYFPSELQSEFPEGVPFEVTDKRTQTYEVDPNQIEIFKGSGNRLGSNFEDKPASMVFLEPLKEPRSTTHSLECLDKSYGKKCVKKRLKTHQENQSRHSNYACNKEFTDNYFSEYMNKVITLKIRFGKSNTESFVMHMNENDRLSKFHDYLQQKLCEKNRADCPKSSDSKFSQADFEVHTYGKNPFRLTDNLHKRLKDCGIIHNSVLNVWEI